MQEMLAPTTAIKGIGLGDKCALITDGRFSGGTAGACIGHISPEAAEGRSYVAANLATVASSVHEATTRYLGWDMYWHRNHEGC